MKGPTLWTASGKQGACSLWQQWLLRLGLAWVPSQSHMGHHCSPTPHNKKLWFWSHDTPSFCCSYHTSPLSTEIHYENVCLPYRKVIVPVTHCHVELCFISLLESSAVWCKPDTLASMGNNFVISISCQIFWVLACLTVHGPFHNLYKLIRYFKVQNSVWNVHKNEVTK